MRTKTILKRNILFCFVLFFSFFTFIYTPAAFGDGSEKPNDVINEIINFNLKKSGAESVQEWIDTDLKNGAGMTSEWYIASLVQSGKTYDYSAYSEALERYVDEKYGKNIVTDQRYALLLSATGKVDCDFVKKAADRTIGKQGIMSFIWGLNLMNNGCECAKYSTDEVVKEILALRLNDGGWALYGENSDVDVTAMAIQALTPYYNKKATVKKAVDNAIQLLSSRQQQNGGYKSFGSENPESTAQVIIALAGIGIDVRSNRRFLKNGNSPYKALLTFRLEDGSFCHNKGGLSNQTATVQSLCALVSLERLQNNSGAFFVFDKVENKVISTKKTSDTDNKEKNSSEQSKIESSQTVIDKTEKSYNKNNSVKKNKSKVVSSNTTEKLQESKEKALVSTEKSEKKNTDSKTENESENSKTADSTVTKNTNKTNKKRNDITKSNIETKKINNRKSEKEKSDIHVILPVIILLILISAIIILIKKRKTTQKK